MKLLYASLLAVLIATPVYASDVRSEIDKVNSVFDKAYAAHDFKKLGELYDQNAVVYAQGSPVIKGRPGIQKLWESYKNDFTNAHFETVEVLDAAPYAIQFGKYDATYQGKPDQGRYITVWKKEGGTWRIVRDSWYSNPTQ
jgi:ketosteroid isomerase-like protein